MPAPIITARRLTFRRLLTWPVILPVMALLLYGGWWLTTPRIYRQVARFPIYYGERDDPAYYGELQPCVDGFCMREKKRVFTFRDWQTGHKLWRVTTAKPNTQGWIISTEKNYPDTYVGRISPRGHWLAVLSSAGRKARLQTWHDGQPAGEVYIPIPRPRPPFPGGSRYTPTAFDRLDSLSLYPCDDGRCFITMNIVPAKQCAPITFLFMVQGGRVVSSGISLDNIWISADGDSATDDNGTIYRLTSNGGKVQLTHPVNTHYPPVEICANDAAFGNGTIYRLSGEQIPIAKGWYACSISPTKRYAIIANQSRMIHVNLRTGKTWEPKLGLTTDNYGGDATEDGRHILAKFTPRSRMVELFSQTFPGLGAYLNISTILVLYRYPGRPIARMHIDSDMSDYNHWFPSPNGRTVVVDMDKGGCRLYRY